MSAQDNGGPAFPVTRHETGMTMRDYFAAKAPPYTDAWVQRYCRNVGYMSDAKCMADWAYEYADAMLDARSKQ